MAGARRALFGMIVIALVALLVLARTPEVAADAEPARASKAQPPIRVAITIDDLPGSAVPAPTYGTARIVTELVSALRTHGVRSATGFVIGARLESDPEARAALAAWIDAGYDVGNHSWSHGSLEELGAEAYLADVARLDPRMRELERASGQRTRYFRYPYLAEGRSERERQLLSRGLEALGYELARVSLDFRDWGWADPYARCMARGDEAALTLLSKSYLESASAALAWSTAAAQKVLRRPLVQVLLLHANVATARNLDALLTAYEQAGAEFVPLSEALADPLYTATYDADISHVLTLSSLQSRRPLPPPQVPPLALLELACR